MLYFLATCCLVMVVVCKLSRGLRQHCMCCKLGVWAVKAQQYDLTPRPEDSVWTRTAWFRDRYTTLHYYITPAINIISFICAVAPILCQLARSDISVSVSVKLGTYRAERGRRVYKLLRILYNVCLRTVLCSSSHFSNQKRDKGLQGTGLKVADKAHRNQEYCRIGNWTLQSCYVWRQFTP